MLKIDCFRSGLLVLLAVLVLAVLGQRAVGAEHDNAPAVTAEGEVRVVHIDYFERGRSETAYLLRDLATGDTFELKFERKPPRTLRTGDQINVRGRAVGRKIWVTDIVAGLQQEGAAETPTAEVTAAAAGERRAVLLVLNMPTGPGYYTPTTVNQADGAMFTDSFSVGGVYEEGSFGKLSFPGPGVGDVFGPLNIPYFAGCPWPSALYWIADGADSAATDAGIDISLYDHKIYLIPPSSISDCSWLAVGELGFYGSTSVYRSWSTRNDVVAYAHELGHNLGWHHAATDPDNDGSMNSEYGDTSDIMGYCCTHRKFNSAHVDQIGWFDDYPGIVVSVAAGGIYDIAPLGSDPVLSVDPQVLRIDKPGTNEDYYLSYRQRIGQDIGLSPAYTTGVNIHHARESGNWTYFIDSLLDGEVFYDATNGITITQLGSGADFVTVDISFGDCVVAAPSVALSPPDQVVSGNGTPTFQVSVTNQDSAGCDPASFDLLAGDLGGLAGDVVPSSLDLAAGTTGAATLTVQAIGADGNYTLWAWASDVDGLRNDAGGSASLQIDSTAPLAPTGVSTAKKKAKGRLAVQVTWDLANDVDPGSGVATYRLYRDGAAIVDTADLSYIDRNVANGVTYSYTLRAVDNAGNWSGLSAAVPYPPDGSGDGSGDGSKSGKGYGKGGKPK